jgi:hypothetical protein
MQTGDKHAAAVAHFTRMVSPGAHPEDAYVEMLPVVLSLQAFVGVRALQNSPNHNIVTMR